MTFDEKWKEASPIVKAVTEKYLKDCFNEKEADLLSKTADCRKQDTLKKFKDFLKDTPELAGLVKVTVDSLELVALYLQEQCEWLREALKEFEEQKQK